MRTFGEVGTLRRLQQWSHGVTLMDREELHSWKNFGSGKHHIESEASHAAMVWTHAEDG